MPNGFEEFTLGASVGQGVADWDDWLSSGLDFPTRPEGPTPDYTESFMSFSDTLRDLEATGTAPGFVASEQTTDWSQLITRAGSFVGEVVRTVGDFTDAIQGRPSSQERAAQAAARQRPMGGMNMLPVLLIGGVLLLAFMSGGRR